MPSVTLNVHLRDDGGFPVRAYPTACTPFVTVRLADGVALHLGDLDTCHALAVALAEVRAALTAIAAAEADREVAS